MILGQLFALAGINFVLSSLPTVFIGFFWRLIFVADEVKVYISGWMEIKLNLTELWLLQYSVLCPRDDSQGSIKICPCPSVCLSVRPSVCHTLRYIYCVSNFSHSFQWIFFKSSILVLDIMKMSILVFDGARINFDRTTGF